MAIDIENQTDLNNQRSLFVTGDDGQLIYSFRGSVIDLILNFEEFYPNSKEIILNQNYRSTKAILDLAEKILSLNPRQKFKELFTENPSKTLDVTYYIARNHQDEGRYIVQHLYKEFVEGDTSRQSSVRANIFEPGEVRVVSILSNERAIPKLVIRESRICLIFILIQLPLLFQLGIFGKTIMAIITITQVVGVSQKLTGTNIRA